MSGNFLFVSMVPSSARTGPSYSGSVSRELRSQPSSRLTYVQPWSMSPFETIASAAARASESLMARPYAFQLFQPIAGVSDSNPSATNVNDFVALPAEFFAVNVTGYRPRVAIVPVMTPVDASSVRPFGRFDAA